MFFAAGVPLGGRGGKRGVRLSGPWIVSRCSGLGPCDGGPLWRTAAARDGQPWRERLLEGIQPRARSFAQRPSQAVQFSAKSRHLGFQRRKACLRLGW